MRKTERKKKEKNTNMKVTKRGEVGGDQVPVNQDQLYDPDHVQGHRNHEGQGPTDPVLDPNPRRNEINTDTSPGKRLRVLGLPPYLYQQL